MEAELQQLGPAGLVVVTMSMWLRYVQSQYKACDTERKENAEAATEAIKSVATLGEVTRDHLKMLHEELVQLRAAIVTCGEETVALRKQLLKRQARRGHDTEGDL